MKPYEETWTVQDLENECRGTFGSCSLPILELTPERLQLAAQAPAMARLLLRYDNAPDDGRTVTLQDFYRDVRDVLRDAGVIP